MSKLYAADRKKMPKSSFAGPGDAAYLREWKRSHPEQVKSYEVKYREKHSESVENHRRAARKHRAANLDKIREADTIAQRERRRDPESNRKINSSRQLNRLAQLEEIAGRPMPLFCEICGNVNEGKNLVFDHCHDTGFFRGWLCDKCNRTLGTVRDSTHLLFRMAEYLERNKKHGKVDDRTSQKYAKLGICRSK